MDKGTDAKRALTNDEIPLKLGYVGVKNRSKQDLLDKLPMKEMFKKERDFFRTHPVYKHMTTSYFGTETLIQKLTKVLFRVIKDHLPKIIKTINDNIKKAEDELVGLGQPMPIDDVGKRSLLWNMLNEFCDTYRSVLKGKYSTKRLDFLKDEGGYKIKTYFKTLLDDFTGDYKATANYGDEYISYALTIHEGDSIPGFPSVDAFYYLLRPELEKVREPINECFANAYNYLEELAAKVLRNSFKRFPQCIDNIEEFVTIFLTEERDKAKYVIDSIVEQEINYLFTNDYEYMQNYTTFTPKNQPRPNVQGQQQQQQPTVDIKTIFIKEIRSRIEAYFKLIIRNLRDTIPKIIGNNLVRVVEDTMQLR